MALWPSPGILWSAGNGIFRELIPKSAGNSFLGSTVGYPENSSGNQAEESLGGGGSCLASPLCSPQSPQRRWERGLTLATCLTVEKGNGGGEIPGDSRLRESRVFQQEMQRYREVCYYMLFALAAYGWPIYLMRKPTCGLCRLARSCS